METEISVINNMNKSLYDEYLAINSKKRKICDEKNELENEIKKKDDELKQLELTKKDAEMKLASNQFYVKDDTNKHFEVKTFSIINMFLNVGSSFSISEIKSDNIEKLLEIIKNNNFKNYSILLNGYTMVVHILVPKKIDVDIKGPLSFVICKNPIDYNSSSSLNDNTYNEFIIEKNNLFKILNDILTFC